jgi:predicted DNA-binding ribbon-helix-helix protein
MAGSTCTDGKARSLPQPDLYAGPVKRSMTIAGHATSISLEPPFWAALEAAALDLALPLNALVARIDAERVEAGATANLASVLRCWLLARALRE